MEEVSFACPPNHNPLGGGTCWFKRRIVKDVPVLTSTAHRNRQERTMYRADEREPDDPCST
jgi:hypothetical protein